LIVGADGSRNINGGERGSREKDGAAAGERESAEEREERVMAGWARCYSGRRYA